MTPTTKEQVIAYEPDFEIVESGDIIWEGEGEDEEVEEIGVRLV